MTRKESIKKKKAMKTVVSMRLWMRKDHGLKVDFCPEVE